MLAFKSALVGVAAALFTSCALAAPASKSNATVTSQGKSSHGKVAPKVMIISMVSSVLE
jgi:hypothetical protein